jgi:predicted N-acetyltransferase YhbS
VSGDRDAAASHAAHRGVARAADGGAGGRGISFWAKRDPDEPHVHLGPVAVDVHLQGQGIGSLMMEQHCRQLDAAGEVGYLETDKLENVRFYERFGFEVVGEAPVIDVPNWFMRRPSR